MGHHKNLRNSFGLGTREYSLIQNYLGRFFPWLEFFSFCFFICGSLVLIVNVILFFQINVDQYVVPDWLLLANKLSIIGLAIILSIRIFSLILLRVKNVVGTRLKSKLMLILFCW